MSSMLEPLRRLARRTFGLALLFSSMGSLLLATASCSVEETLPPPWCEGSGSVFIVAQSVPSAALVPCLEALPDGWSIASVRVTQGGSAVVLDSDRAGDNAAELLFESSCDVSVGVTSPSEQADAQRFDNIEQLSPRFRSQRHYVFDGGCVSWFFDLDDGVSATESVAIGERLRLVSRRSLNDQLSQTFIDEDL